MDASSSLDRSMITPIPHLTKFGYGVGHVLNDLCASMWFTYLLIFFHKVVNMDNVLAGTLLLIGQIADAIATPLVGYESDQINGFFGYGKRKSWHLIGCICVAISFPFIFMVPMGNDPLIYSMEGNSDNSMLTNIIYYSPFIVLFQFGWASTQISHLSLIPELTRCEHDRVGLNSIRYAFTVISNVAVYGLALLFLSLECKRRDSTEIDPQDYVVFRNVMLIVIGTGSVFVLIFHVTVKEKTASERLLHEKSFSSSIKTEMKVMCWLKTPQFYNVAALYMCTRLIVNVSQVYLSMYLTESVDLGKTYIAIVPLVIYIAGFISTFPMRALSKRVGKKILFSVGLLFVASASVGYEFIAATDKYGNYYAIIAGAASGIGGSTILIISLSLTADLIDHNTESGAFVYGAMSFTDKLSNGITIQIIQLLHPCKTSACCPACAPFYRNIMAFVPSGLCVLAFITLMFIRRRQTTYSEVTDVEPRQPLIQDAPLNYGSVDTMSSANDASPVVSPPTSNGGASYRRPSFIVGSMPEST